MIRKQVFTVFTALAIALPTAAAAQQYRSGFWINGGIGLGSYGCEGCDGRESGGSATLSLGGTLSQKVSLGVGINVWAKEYEGLDLTTSTLTALIRFYPSATGGFYLTGGLGIASESVSADDISVSVSGTGVLLGLGYDIRIGNNISLTPFWHGNGMAFDEGNSNFGQLGLSLTVH